MYYFHYYEDLTRVQLANKDVFYRYTVAPLTAPIENPFIPINISHKCKLGDIKIGYDAGIEAI